MVVMGQTKQAAAAKTSLTYLTVGALTVVWTVIWYVYLKNNGAAPNTFLWVYGFLATGIVLLIIGGGVGVIRRSAMPAETAPTPGVVENVVAAPAAPSVVQAPPAAPAVNFSNLPPAAASPAQARRM